MMSFIISAVVLVVIALLFVIPTLLKKNQSFSDEYDELNVSIAKDRLKEIKQQRDSGELTEEEFQQQQAELESSLALDLSNSSQAESKSVTGQNRLIPALVALFIPLVAIAVYSQLGDFNAVTGQGIASVSIPAGENRPQMSMQEAVVKLEQKLSEDASNPDGWFMLAKTYMVTKQYHKAKAAYEKTIELVGEEPELLMRYVDAVAMTEDGNLTGSAKPILEKLISQMPDNPTILWMAGTAENQAGNYKKALGFWYKLQPILKDDVESLAQIEQLIKKAESFLSADEIAQLKQDVPAVEKPAVTASAAEIIVSVELDPALREKVSANDTLFVFAKALQGPPMPLAAVKQTVASLPLTVSLNDAMAMMPQMKLSSFEQVKISAVISKSGQPGVKAGDLFAEVSPVNVGSQDKINLVINQVK